METQVTMASIFRQIQDLPLDELIKQTNQALTLAPFIDPTLYIKKANDADCMLNIAKAFQVCRDTIAKEFWK